MQQTGIMHLNYFWILLFFTVSTLATSPPLIQRNLIPHLDSLKSAADSSQLTDCNPAEVQNSKWLTRKPRKSSIAIVRRGMNATSDCQSKPAKRMTQEEDRKWTNAKRLAEGFPIKPPKIRKPTRAGIPRQEPSATPTETEGTVDVLTSSDEDGTIIDNLGSITYSSAAKDGLYTYISGAGDANSPLVLSVDIAAAKAGPTYITTRNGPDSAYAYFGGIISDSATRPGMWPADIEGFPIVSWSDYYVSFGATVLTAPGAYGFEDSMAQRQTGYTYVVESSIFTIDSDGNLHATWTNQDGSTVELYFAMISYTYEGISYTSGPSGFGDKTRAQYTVPYGATNVSVKWVNIHFANA